MRYAKHVAHIEEKTGAGSVLVWKFEQNRLLLRAGRQLDSGIRMNI
jgi:hypothetical protein